MRATTKHNLIGGLAALVATGALSFGVVAWAGTPASTAADVCAAAANPCNVTDIFDVANGASLDFGTRAVSVSGGGQFDFGIGSGSILCGNFTASTTNPTIKAAGPGPVSGTQSGTVTLKARRACTGLDAQSKTVPCIDLNDCQIGSCDKRRCSLKSTKTCNSEPDCLGTCTLINNRKKCSNATAVVCSTNADCNYGTCPVQLTCSNRAENPAACATNADCNFGTCAVGTASITMGGAISGNSDSPAFVTLRAADNVTISKLVNLNSTFIENDGGDFVVDAAAGAVVITAKINANGGGNAQGGTVEIGAGTDVTIGEEMDVSGGDFDGGSVDITAGRDLTIGRSIQANSNSGGGFGGEILFDAGRDLIVNGLALNKTDIQTSGSTDLENFAGDGGTQDYTTGRHMALNVNTRLIGNGSAPDGYGSDMFFDVSGDFTLGGTVRANAGLGKGSGGFLEFLVEGKSTIGTAGEFEALGGEGGGGSLEFSSTGNVDWAGRSDVSGSNGGLGGTTFVDSGATATVSGTLFVGGANGGSLEVDACRLTLTGTGKIDNNAGLGDNKLVSRESMKLLAGSAVTNDTGTNTLEYRTSAKPPLLQGTVTPSPTLVLNPALLPCPVCGNDELDGTETCDDGNTTSSDGCSSTCQNEDCLAQTISPGFPTVPLCEDGNLCTADVCITGPNNIGTCQHPAKNCADAFACTVDTCTGGTGACLHTPNDSLCNDGNVCTDDFCAANTGCGGTANTDPCNDSNTCTESDICSNKSCAGSQIPGCGVCGDGQVNQPEQCDDGNATFTKGEYCGVGCVKIGCGDTNADGQITASDALFALKTAVGQTTCSLKVCDVDNSTKVLSSDSLRILRKAVGQTLVLNCPTT